MLGLLLQAPLVIALTSGNVSVALAQNSSPAVAATTGDAKTEPASAPLAGDEAPGEVQAPVVAPAASRLEEVNRLILLQEVALEKHSINFRHYHNIQGRWKGWRYFATQEANNVLTAAGLTTQLAERWRIYNHPYTLATQTVTVKNARTGLSHKEIRPLGVLQRTRRSVLEAGVYPQMVGQCLAMGGSTLEYGINSYHRRQASKYGLECKASIRQVRTYKDNMEALFAEREKLIKDGAVADAELARAEGAVLRDTTNISLKEYEDFHVNTRRFRTLQDTLYFFDVARNATGIAGNIVNLVGYHEGSSYLGGPASVMTTVSGALGIMTPIASRGWAKVVGDAHRRLIRKGVGTCEVCSQEQYDLDRKNLMALMADKRNQGVILSDKSTLLMSAYEHSARQREAQFKLSARDQRAGVRAAQENVVSGSIVGSTKVAQGVAGVISGYGLTTSNHRGNDIVLPCTITYLAGTWFSAGENIRLRVVDEVNRYNLGKKGLLPNQVLATRMKALDKLQKNLESVQ